MEKSIVSFLKQKDYIMINNDLGGGSFGKLWAVEVKISFWVVVLTFINI